MEAVSDSPVSFAVEKQVRFGRELREEREQRGMTIEEIARATRFSVRHLQSLEADLFDELPGGVLRKGIVRGYCRHLGLDDELWLERFADSGGLDASEPDLAQFAENVHRARLESMPQVRRRWWGVIVMALVLFALGYAVWHYVVQPRVGLHWHRTPPAPTASPVTASLGTPSRALALGASTVHGIAETE
jgi:cytoskeletal protein RodZ